MRKIVLITGGQRSGKSRFAENLALQAAPQALYMATATIPDEEFRLRVERHQARRGSQWRTIEEPMYLSRHTVAGQVVLIDSVTFWCTHFLFDRHDDPDRAFEAFRTEFDRFVAQEATFLFVTDEVGSGGVSPNALQRKFTDLQGWANQYIASVADEVYLMVAGLPLRVKPSPSGL